MSWILLAQAAAGQAAPAATAQPQAAAGGASSLVGMFITFGAIFVVFYLLLIRPQKKQEKARQEMLKGLKKNDRVVTIGGIHGTVASVREKDATLKLDDAGNVKVRFSRSAISQILTKDEEEQETGE